MTNRTMQDLARRHAELGMFSFRVATPKSHFTTIEFTVDLEQPILLPQEHWLTGYWFFYQPMACFHALPTLFGQELLDRLRDMRGIQCSLDNERPNRIHLFVLNDLVHGASQFGPSGLPLSISVALEEAILASRPTLAAKARWLRRFV